MPEPVGFVLCFALGIVLHLHVWSWTRDVPPGTVREQIVDVVRKCQVFGSYLFVMWLIAQAVEWGWR